MTGLRRIIRRIGRRGVSTIEFALVTPILLLIIVGVMNFGAALQESNKLEDSARSGLQFAVTFPSDAAGICRTTCNTLPQNWRTDTTIRVSYRCGTNTAVVRTCAQATSCAQTAAPYETPCTTPPFVIGISLDRPFEPFALVPFPTTVSGNATFRTR